MLPRMHVHLPKGRLLAILLTRVVLNINFRIVYPFLPAISRGAGISLAEAGTFLSVRALAAATSPLYGLMSDRIGRRRLMLMGILAAIASALLMSLAPAAIFVAGAFALCGLSKASYDPAMQAYVADTVPYTVRGRVMALTELAWAGSWLIGVPAAGLLIAAAGWRAPFVVVALLALVALLVTWRALPEPPRPALQQSRLSLRQIGRSTILALTVSLLLVSSNEMVFVVYGAWMEQQFALPVAALGAVSIVISLAELVAETGSARWIDRLGKRRGVLLGIGLNLLAYLALPFAAGSLWTALLAIGVLFLGFEFAVVALLPLISELSTGARATVMALNVAAMSMGRFAGSFAGPRLWSTSGISLNVGVAMALLALAGAVLLAMPADRRLGRASTAAGSAEDV